MPRARDSFALAALVLVAGCAKASADSAPPASKNVPMSATSAAPFAAQPTPGSIPCGEKESCPVSKSARRVCCNAPGVPPTCKAADKCGQATKFRYSGMLSCNETADCTAIDKGRDVVCCLSDDGFRADGVAGPWDRASCMPRAACAGSDIVACVSDSECAKGTSCRAVSMGAGITVGGCVP